MNKEYKGALVGMALGDGHIQVFTRDMVSRAGTPYKAINARLVINHSGKQREYLEYKADRLQSIFGGRRVAITSYEQYLKKTGKSYPIVKISKGHKYFRVLRRFLYPNGIKTYRRSVLNTLTPEGLAFWYQDDGTLKKIRNKAGEVTAINAMISTYCSEQEANLITEYFKEVWDIEFRAKYHRYTNRWVVTARTSEAKKFFKIILPHIHQSMMYKIDLV